MKHINVQISRILSGITALFYLWILIQVLFFDNIHGNDTGTLVVWMFAGLAVMGGFFILFRRVEDWIKRWYHFLVPAFLVVYGIALIRIGFLLRFTPCFDMDAIYSGAIQWLQEGSFRDFYEYYGYFPNNLGAMGFLYLIFSVTSWFGITDFFAVGIVVNSFLILGTIYTVSWICCRLAGEIAGLLALVGVLLCFPFLFMGAAFYTDSLSLLFPPLFYALYLKFKEKEDWKHRIVFAVLMGVSLGIGILIKFTVVIILIAVLIEALLTIHWKKVLCIAGASLLVSLGMYTGYQSYIYHCHLTDETYQDLKTPYWHWIMMGLQNAGSYNPEDYEYTRSFSVDERAAACRERIKERVDALGLSGLFHLWSQKTVVCFGDGTYALSDFLDDSPQEETALHEAVLYDGAHYGGYRQMTTGLLLMFYVLAVLGMIGRRQELVTGPRLAMAGIFCFLLLWETSGRYFTNYVPMILISAVLTVGNKREDI